uniref:Uncharacterized protein n=1 Tax=Siphoviridae sp. ctv4j104 TaxID=2826510 RepID=A0A8S5M9M6_9CAUD|nr:MAG TPA: hypothetical protein [Siphoviridae sp. ctv4j104]DAQ37440.1 MAG TPA: hypothetical protein [Caudoviricetes sp.]
MVLLRPKLANKVRICRPAYFGGRVYFDRLV